MTEIELIQGDITKIAADVIVNAANTSLLGGGGVDGAIHRAAGSELLEECRNLNGCKTGEAKITRGYQLPARHVIHTAGPVWHGGTGNEAALLALCYLNSLKLAQDNGLKTIAFPNISTGVYGYPKQEAAAIALAAVKKWLKSNHGINRILFVIFDDENFKIYKKMLAD
jgi:O-acetyl-ADP-ribose deacetylase (regulator of RNase III)